jgi:hypothetical protein
VELIWKNHQKVESTWPSQGQVILASYNDDEVVVYQAYKPSIADYAVENQKFGGEFSFSRMTWIKPNFLWMMYRSGWAQKVDQERILAISLCRRGFAELLSKAAYSSFQPDIHDSHEHWKTRLEGDVRLQWDPDHAPNGTATERRAIQLGIRAETLREMNENWIREIQDITKIVELNRERLRDPSALQVPFERVFDTY